MSNERFARIEQMIGAEGLEGLRRSSVLVVGLGAVGSYAVEALARAGVGRMRLVDFDEVRPSNINRQLFALESTLGQPKVEVAFRRVKDINPSCEVERLREFVHVETLDRILNGRYDVVVDAIDSFNPKVELLTSVVGRRIPVVSSMGAALRRDATCVRVGPLRDVIRCRLARRIRKRLRRRGIATDFPCVYSIEAVEDRPAETDDTENKDVNDIALADEDVEDEDETDEESEGEALSRGRKRRALGSLPTVTGIFGLTAANEALRILLSV